MQNEIPKHIIRYGAHPEKPFFETPFDALYDGVLLNANTVAYSTRGIAEFLTQRLNKPFCIDPLTHAFGHSPIHIAKNTGEGELEVRAAFKSLAQHYGQPVISQLGRRGLRPDDFHQGGRLLEQFCEQVVHFQKNIISAQLAEEGDDKYIPAQRQSPCLVIAPYFYMTSSTFHFWLDLNKSLIDASVPLESILPVFGYILISKDAFFDDDLRGELLVSCKGTEARGFMLWIESFSEHGATKSELNKYRQFVSNLSQGGRKVISLYGGYFSIMLQKYGLHGVTHGPGYGEEREVTPVGGGLPKPKFYFPALHERLPFREVLFAIRTKAKWSSASDYYGNVCDCVWCKQTIGEDMSNFMKYGESKSGVRKDGISFEYQTTQAKILNTAHYLLNKDKEFKFVAANEVQLLKEDLQDSMRKHRGNFELERLGHLANWLGGLS